MKDQVELLIKLGLSEKQVIAFIESSITEFVKYHNFHVADVIDNNTIERYIRVKYFKS